MSVALPLVSFDAIMLASPQRLAKNLLFPPDEPSTRPEDNKHFSEPLDQKAWIEKSARYKEILNRTANKE
jgi:hypothetical protein